MIDMFRNMEATGEPGLTSTSNSSKQDAVAVLLRRKTEHRGKRQNIGLINLGQKSKSCFLYCGLT